MSKRQEMRDDLVGRFEVEEARDGVRLITLAGAVVGRLGQDKETGNWQLDYKARWMRERSELVGSGEAEHAELWACDEIAHYMAIERQAYDERKPWGEERPPGVD